MRRRAYRLLVVVDVALVAAAPFVGGVDPAHATAAFRPGYELVGSDGGVFAFSPGTFSGSLGDRLVPGRIVAALDASVNAPESAAGDAPGYLLVSDAGVVYPFGVHSLGDLRGVRLNAPVVGAAAVGGGYFLVAADGGVFAFGSAKFAGSLAARRLPAPIVGMAVTLTGDGYWLVDSLGDVYPFGDAQFYGGVGGLKLDVPVVGISENAYFATRSLREGYLLATANGRVFPFGAARYAGDASTLHLRAPVAGILSQFGGYYLFAQDGGVFTFGTEFRGSAGGRHLNGPIVAMVPRAVISCKPEPNVGNC